VVDKVTQLSVLVFESSRIAPVSKVSGVRSGIAALVDGQSAAAQIDALVERYTIYGRAVRK
jgi:hypothetical protein